MSYQSKLQEESYGFWKLWSLIIIWVLCLSPALDVVFYGEHFMGMKLAGMILIAVGFFLVMFPDNWPDYITRLLR